MRYIQSYATTAPTADKISPTNSTKLMDNVRSFGMTDSMDLILAGVAGLATGPMWGFQKKGFFKYLYYILNVLSIAWGAWGASMTGGSLYMFGSKLF
jgi:hypothetical protein